MLNLIHGYHERLASGRRYGWARINTAIRPVTEFELETGKALAIAKKQAAAENEAGAL